jgi:hypothetical protein
VEFKARIAVFGGRDVDQETYDQAVELGQRMAQEDWLVFCGGGPGVMEAIAKGVHSGGGICVGILKGTSLEEANPYIHVPVATGMGIARNALLAYNGEVAVAINGSYGTLSEIAYALQLKRPVIGLGTWDLKEIINVKTPSEVISKIKGIIS